VAVGGIAAITALHLGPVRLALEDRLGERARADLAAVGLDGVTVGVTGLEARLSGDVPREVDIDLAVSTVDRVPGVARIDSSGVAVQPLGEAAPTGSPEAEPTADPTPGSGPVTPYPNGATGTPVPAGSPTQPPAEPPAVAAARAALAAVPPVTFEPNSVVLTEEGLASVGAVAGIVATTGPEVRFRIEAHTDTGGPPEVNKALSVRRATAVRAALLELGVARTRVQAVGLGETRPLVRPEVTEEDRRANRRVEIVAEAVPGA
jgi:outer membrane protein OmpA-like peptidoglycan-associated protein